MRKFVAIIALSLLTSTAQAQDWCGQTISVSTALNQHQNCAGRPGIRLSSNVVLDLNGYAVSGATNSCIRSIVGGRNISVKNGTIQGCGEEGIKYDGVYNGRVTNVNLFNNVREGMWCIGCSQLIARWVDARSNLRGFRVENGGSLGENRLEYVTVIGNRIEGVLVKGGTKSLVYQSWLDGNTAEDLVYDATTAGRALSNPWLGDVFFRNGATNNRLLRSSYRTCLGDGTGSGSNSCG